MHKILKGICLIGVLLLAVIPALAQDATEVFMPTATAIPAPFMVDPTMGYDGNPGLAARSPQG